MKPAWSVVSAQKLRSGKYCTGFKSKGHLPLFFFPPSLPKLLCPLNTQSCCCCLCFLPWGLSGPILGAVSSRSVLLSVSNPHGTFYLRDVKRGACKGLGSFQKSWFQGLVWACGVLEDNWLFIKHQESIIRWYTWKCVFLLKITPSTHMIQISSDNLDLDTYVTTRKIIHVM